MSRRLPAIERATNCSIGKSRLIEELAARASAGGAQILVGRCWEAGGAPAYRLWIQALRAYLQATPDAELAARIGAAEIEHARVLGDFEGTQDAELHRV